MSKRRRTTQHSRTQQPGRSTSSTSSTRTTGAPTSRPTGALGAAPTSAPGPAPTTSLQWSPLELLPAQSPPPQSLPPQSLPPQSLPPQRAAAPPVGTDQVRQLVGIIATGGLDEHLATVSAAIGERHRHLERARANTAAARLAVGDRVRLNHDIRPLYLHGATGTVVDWAGGRAVVHLDAPVGRFTRGEIRCPPLGLDVLPD